MLRRAPLGISTGCCMETSLTINFILKKIIIIKSSRDSVSADFQGLWKITTHLAPGFVLNDLAPLPVNVADFRGLLGPGGSNSLYQMSLQQWNCFSPCGPRTSQTPLCSWGFALPIGAPPGMELQSCRLCASLVYSLNGI